MFQLFIVAFEGQHMQGRHGKTRRRFREIFNFSSQNFEKNSAIGSNFSMIVRNP